jgi:hypothetical protein
LDKKGEARVESCVKHERESEEQLEKDDAQHFSDEAYFHIAVKGTDSEMRLVLVVLNICARILHIG